jgi:tetratricopeptide (TPR) repeat protein
MNIVRLINQGESAKIDFKREWYWNDDTPDSIKKLKFGELVKDIFSLTNGDKYSINETAYLIIGILDETREVCDFDFPKDHNGNHKNKEKLKQDLLNKLNTYSSPEFIALDVNYHQLEEKTIIVISILPRGELISLSKDLKYGRNGKTVIDPKGTVYYRRGEANHVASESIIKDFKKAYAEEHRREILKLMEKFGVKGEEFLKSLFGDDYEKVLENPKTYTNLKLKLEKKDQTLKSILKDKADLEEKVKSQNLDSDIERKVKLAIQELRFDDVIDILDKYLVNIAVTHEKIYKAHYLKAIIYIEMFKYSNAVEEIEFIPYKKLTNFGILNDYAQIYRLDEKYDSALKIYDFISSSQQEYLESHPFQLAMFYNNVAEISESLGEFGNTEKYYKDTLEILEEYFESDNENTVINESLATVYNNLGSLLSRPPRYNEAEEYFQKSLDIRHRLYGEKDILTIESYSNFATFYIKKEDYDKAEILFSKSLELSLRHLGENHPQTATIYNNFAEFYRKKGNYDFNELEELYAKSLQIRKVLYGKFHSLVADIYNNKGELYRENDEPEKAIHYYEKALLIYKKIFGVENHYNIATIYNNMGLAYSTLSQVIPSIKYLNMALEMRVSIYGKNNFDVGGSHLNLYGVYFESGNMRKAYYHIKKTAAIWESILQSTDPYLFEAKKHLVYFEGY